MGGDGDVYCCQTLRKEDLLKCRYLALKSLSRAVKYVSEENVFVLCISKCALMKHRNNFAIVSEFAMVSNFAMVSDFAMASDLAEPP